MSGSNNLNFSLKGSASTTNEKAGNTKTMIDDCKRNNYTSPQENFKYTDFNKSSVDWNHEVNEVYKEEIMKQRMILDLLSSRF